MATSTRMQRRTPSPFGLFPLLTRDIDLLQANMRRILQNRPASGESAGTMSQALAWTPAVEISETPDELVITAELPGINADEAHVVIDGDTLTICGEKRSERREGDEDTQFYLVERSYGSFQRSFTLPSTVDPESIVAEFNNGVLTIHLQKVDAERTRGREIPISAGASGGSQRKAVAGGSQQSPNAGSQSRQTSAQNRETASALNRGASGGAQNRDASSSSQSKAANAANSSGSASAAGSASGSASGSTSGSGSSSGSTSGSGSGGGASGQSGRS